MCDHPRPDLCAKYSKHMIGKVLEKYLGDEEFRANWERLHGPDSRATPFAITNRDTQRVVLPCIHVGDDTWTAQDGSGKRWSTCEHPDQPLGTPVCPCKGCGVKCRGYECDDGYDRVSAYAPRSGDPSCGVVIGSYGWPSLVELQLRVLRVTSGALPVCVSDDANDARVAAICSKYPNVRYWPNTTRIGHTGGDVSAFYKGVVWGSENRLDVVAKLSQRFLMLRGRWLQDGSRDLLSSGLPCSARRCTGASIFPLRTEAVLMDVRQWNQAHVLSSIRPRKYWNDHPRGLNAETVIHRVLQDDLGGRYWPWGLVPEDRGTPSPDFLWHQANTRSDYAALSDHFGVTLDTDFHTDGWQKELDNGKYLYG